jgi:hypothetical protein
MRALDVQQAAYRSESVDRAIVAAAEAVDGLAQRRFFTEIKTCSWDWPNFQYTYPWKLWLEAQELAGQPTLVVSGSLEPIPTIIPSGDYILGPVNIGPPFTNIELRRDTNAAFGFGSTPQLDIAITGPFGYWDKTRLAGSLTAGIGTTDLVVSVSNANLVGVGDVLICGAERMVVWDANYVDTGIVFLTGITTAQASDRVGTVTDGTKFSRGEVIMVDFEWMMIVQIVGNNIVVKRAWDGSALATHAGGDIWAERSYSVLRGQLGTISATATTGTALSVSEVPGLIRELAIAESVVWLAQEPAGYSGASAAQPQGSQNEPKPGAGLPDLRARVLNSKYTRNLRKRAV